MSCIDDGGGPLVFVSDLNAPELNAHDRHHMERVLRFRAGDSIMVGDGEGRWRACRYGDRLEIVGEVVASVAPAQTISIAFALVKGQRPELVVQKLTELGVDRIVPFVAARSVVRWSDDRARSQVDRLRHIAREAAMQCRRGFLPDVADLATFAEVVAAPDVVLADRGGGPPRAGIATALIGPEGGWSTEERATASKAGVQSISLGENVLRAETAAIAVAAMLVALRGGLLLPAPVRGVAGPGGDNYCT